MPNPLEEIAIAGKIVKAVAPEAAEHAAAAGARFAQEALGLGKIAGTAAPDVAGVGASPFEKFAAANYKLVPTRDLAVDIRTAKGFGMSGEPQIFEPKISTNLGGITGVRFGKGLTPIDSEMGSVGEHTLGLGQVKEGASPFAAYDQSAYRWVRIGTHTIVMQPNL